MSAPAAPSAESAESGERRWCLVIDTNQWLAHLMLRSPTAAALLYSLKQQDGVIGLPFVVEEELKRRALREGVDALEQITKELGKLRQLLGSAPEPTLPSEDVLRTAAARRLDELAPLLKRAPYTHHQAERALRRLLDKIPPNGEKNQQYKDSLIWEAALDLSAEFSVVLVTSDRGFYSSKDSTSLAAELQTELDTTGQRIVMAKDLQEAAELLRTTEPPFDADQVTSVVDAAVLEETLTATAVAQDFAVGELSDSTLRVLATENPNAIAVSFSIQHALEDLRTPARGSAIAVAEGDCLVLEGRVFNLRMVGLALEWVDESGEPGRSKSAFVHPDSIVIGERHRPYTVRQVIYE